jgi:hypothetical protein
MTTGRHNVTNKEYARQITRSAGIEPGTYDRPEVRDDSPVFRQIAAEVKNRAHEATVTPDGEGGYEVSCPHGCRLGSSAFQPTQKQADRRAELHRIATTPLAGSPDTRPQTVVQWTNENGIEMTGRAATGEGVRELLEAVNKLGGYLRVMEDQS